MLGLIIVALSILAIWMLVMAMIDWERFIIHLLIGGFVLFIGAIMLIGTCFHTGQGGQGVSVGVVTNVSRHGVFFQPWSVWIVHQGEMKAEEFGVTQEDAALLDRLRQDADAGRRVRVFYDSSVICGAWNQASCDVITRIEEEP